MHDDFIFLALLPGGGNPTLLMLLFAALSGIHGAISRKHFISNRYVKAFFHCFVAGFAMALAFSMAYIEIYFLHIHK